MVTSLYCSSSSSHCMYCSTVIVILHETKLTASVGVCVTVTQQELVRVLEQCVSAHCTDLNVGEVMVTLCREM